MVILQTKELAIQLQHKAILRRVNVSLLEGKRTAIIGPNGSGKSTLVKALSGLLPASSGQVFFEGLEISAFGKKRLAQKLAVLPQGSGVPAELTVGELVEYGRFPHRSWWKRDYAADAAAVAWALQQTGMAHMTGRLLSTLSGGERQRAWIAMALAQQPKVLLLDEPTTYLDIAHQLEVMQILADLNKTNGISVVMVLHDLQHAMQYADEVIVVKEGTVFAAGTPPEVLTVELLNAVFGVRAEFFTNARGATILAPTGLCKACR